MKSRTEIFLDGSSPTLIGVLGFSMTTASVLTFLRSLIRWDWHGWDIPTVIIISMYFVGGIFLLMRCYDEIEAQRKATAVPEDPAPPVPPESG